MRKWMNRATGWVATAAPLALFMARLGAGKKW